MSLATVSEQGNPGNAPVFFAYDDKYCFYWGSYKDAQHSKNIRQNGKTYFVIYDSTVPAGSGKGVYVQADAKELSDKDEITLAHKLLWDRHTVPYWMIEQFFDNAPIRIYKAVPQKIWINGEEKACGHYVDTREEVHLI